MSVQIKFNKIWCLSLIVGLIVPLETQHGNKVMVSEMQFIKIKSYRQNVRLTHFIWSAFHVICLSKVAT